jgi:pimeloyl-ACP methyl ester carboxylesterase
LGDAFHLVAPDYPGFGHSDTPDPAGFAYTFDHLAEVIDGFTTKLGLTRYVLGLQDYGGPIGFRLALAHPDRVQALIVQNAVVHEDGLGPLWCGTPCESQGQGTSRARWSYERTWSRWTATLRLAHGRIAEARRAIGPLMTSFWQDVTGMAKSAIAPDTRSLGAAACQDLVKPGDEDLFATRVAHVAEIAADEEVLAGPSRRDDEVVLDREDRVLHPVEG